MTLAANIKRHGALFGFVVCALLLAWHAVGYIPFFADDSFISLRYSERFLEGRGLTWTDGERVEGYSNFLWVLLVALAGLPGQDLIATARVLGVACTVSMLLAYFWIHRGAPRATAVFAGLVSGLLVGLAGPTAAHAVAGLEQPLLSALVVWALATTLPLLEAERATFRQLLIPGILFGLASLTRPDAPLIVAASCGAFLLARGLGREALRIAASIAAIAALFYLAQLAFRLGYYGEWVPNTARGKVSLTSKRLASGWKYVSEGAAQLYAIGIVLLLGAWGAFRDPRLRGRYLLVVTPMLVWCAFIVSIGGDHVPQRRHLCVAVGMAGLAVSLVVAWWLGARPRFARPTLVVALVLVAATAFTTMTSRDRQRAQRNRWFWTGQPVGLFLRRAFAEEQPFVAVDAAGALPYFSKLPALDMLGLTDRHIAHHPPKTLGRGKLAHELGDGAYVLSRRPDLVVFNTPRGGAKPNWRSGRQMLRDPRFRRDYRLVTFEVGNGRPMTSRMWVRLDGAVGLRQAPDELEIPGYLLSHGAKSRAGFDEDGELVLRVTRKHSARLAGLRLGPGTWSIRVDGTGGAPRVEVRDERGHTLGNANDELVLATTTDVRIDVVNEADQAGRLRAIILTRSN